MLNLLFDSEKICLFCLDNKEDLKNYICPYCRDNLEIKHSQLRSNFNYLDSCYYSLYYNRFIKKILHDFKFNDKSYLYKALGELIIESIISNSLDREIDLILYVPLHRRKEAKRGYNQAELLANYISRKLSIEICHNLKKVKSTKDQHRLNKMERQSNLTNAFRLKNGQDLTAKTILLIDDLVTTGATLDECSKLLKENKVKKVIGMCLASVRQ